MDLYQLQNVYPMTQALMNADEVAVAGGGPQQPSPSTSFNQSSQGGLKPVMPVAPIMQSTNGHLYSSSVYSNSRFLFYIT